MLRWSENPQYLIRITITFQEKLRQMLTWFLVKIILQWGSCSYNWNIKNIMQYNHFKLITTIFLSFCLSSLKAYPVHDFQIASVLRCLVRAPPLHESKRPHTTFSNEISLHTLKYTGSNISKKIEKQSPRGVL